MTAVSTWTGSLSFASPESDFTARSKTQVHLKENGSERFHGSSLTSLESDFSSDGYNTKEISPESPTHEWSNRLSFTSPESDFSSDFKSEQYSYPSPENNDIPLTISCPETAFGSIPLSEIIDSQLLKDLQRDKQRNEDPLPTSLEEIHANPQDPRAIVVTSAHAPFDVVDVNDAWVGLCGYSREESRNQSLAKLLQGPETDQDVLQNFMKLLREGQQVSTVVTNYTKEGRKFRNRVRAAPLRDHGEITHFVGILQEIA
jgi:PAS domain S-box-containing protein